MSTTIVLTIVTPDSIQAVEDQLNTNPATGTVTEETSISNVARYIDGIANGALNVTSFAITSIS